MENSINNSLHTFAVCAYKESPYLEECLKSLQSQTIDGKILLVTSTPNTFIKKIAEKYKIPLYINSNGGIVQDWNFAYDKAETKYVTVTHQDDVYFENYRKNVLDMMEKAKKPIIYFTDYVEIREKRRIANNNLLRIKRIMLYPLHFTFFQKRRFVRRLILAFGSPICCPSVTFAKRNIPGHPFSVGFRSCEDWQAWEYLSRLKGEFLYDRNKNVGHRIHKESETTNILNDGARIQEDYQMFCKFWPPFIAKKLVKLYSCSEKSNSLGER